MTTQPENTDKVEQISKDELTDKEMDEVTGGDGNTTTTTTTTVGLGLRKSGGDASKAGSGFLY